MRRWHRPAGRYDPRGGGAGCLRPDGFRHDLEGFVDRCPILQSLRFRRMEVYEEKSARRYQQRGQQEPRQQAIAPAGLLLRDQKIKLVFSDRQSS